MGPGVAAGGSTLVLRHAIVEIAAAATVVQMNQGLACERANAM